MPRTGSASPSWHSASAESSSPGRGSVRGARDQLSTSTSHCASSPWHRSVGARHPHSHDANLPRGNPVPSPVTARVPAPRPATLSVLVPRGFGTPALPARTPHPTSAQGFTAPARRSHGNLGAHPPVSSSAQCECLGPGSLQTTPIFIVDYCSVLFSISSRAFLSFLHFFPPPIFPFKNSFKEIQKTVQLFWTL